MRVIFFAISIHLVLINSANVASSQTPGSNPTITFPPQDTLSTQAMLNLISKMGGTAETDGSGNIVGLFLWNGDRSWAGKRHTLVRDADLLRFAGLTHLVKLDLDGTQVTDAGLKHLKALKMLEELNLNRTGVTDVGLHSLGGLTKLAKLSLDYDRITGPGLQDLKGLSKLRSLSLLHTELNDTSLANLSRLTQLEELVLDHNRITDAGLPDLDKLTNLKELWLQNSDVTDAGLVQLKDLTKNGVPPASSNLLHYRRAATNASLHAKARPL